jgi:hypothetical protein
MSDIEQIRKRADAVLRGDFGGDVVGASWDAINDRATLLATIDAQRDAKETLKGPTYDAMNTPDLEQIRPLTAEELAEVRGRHQEDERDADRTREQMFDAAIQCFNDRAALLATIDALSRIGR